MQNRLDAIHSVHAQVKPYTYLPYARTYRILASRLRPVFLTSNLVQADWGLFVRPFVYESWVVIAVFALILLILEGSNIEEKYEETARVGATSGENELCTE